MFNYNSKRKPILLLRANGEKRHLSSFCFFGLLALVQVAPYFFWKEASFLYLSLVLQGLILSLGLFFGNTRFLALLFLFLWAFQITPYLTTTKQPENCGNLPRVITAQLTRLVSEGWQLGIMRLQCGKKIIRTYNSGIFNFPEQSFPYFKYAAPGNWVEISGVQQTSAESHLILNSTPQSQLYNLTHEERLFNHSPLKTYIGAKADYYLAGQVRGLFKALVLNDRKALSPDLKKHIMDLGVFHLFAVSGLHAGMLYLWLSLVLRVFFHLPYPGNQGGLGKLLLGLLSLCLLYLYFDFIAMPTTAWRAWLMLLFWFWVRHFVGHWPNLFLLLFAATLMLLLDPLLIGQLGFRFSFLSVLGIFLVLPHLPPVNGQTFFLKTGKIFLNTLIVVVTITLFVLPLQINAFHYLSSFSIFNNLWHVPYLGFIFLPFCLFALVISTLPFLNDGNVVEILAYKGVELAGNFWGILIEHNARLNQPFIFRFESDFRLNAWEISAYWIVLLVIFLWLKNRTRKNDPSTKK